MGADAAGRGTRRLDHGDGETAQSALQLAQRAGVELPIIEEVQRVLFQGKPPRQALAELMARDLKPEQRNK